MRGDVTALVEVDGDEVRHQTALAFAGARRR
jgi:hypothetical protein